MVANQHTSTPFLEHEGGGAGENRLKAALN
jgi:hypothetical protein